MSFQAKIKHINNQFISVFAVMDGWCDSNLSGDNAVRQEMVETFLLESACVFETVKVKLPALGKAETNGGDVLGIQHCHNDGCKAHKNILRNSLRNQLFAGLCLLEQLTLIHHDQPTNELKDALWILEAIAEKGTSFISQRILAEQYQV